MSYHVIPIRIAIRDGSLFNSGAQERGLLRGLGFNLKVQRNTVGQCFLYYIHVSKKEALLTYVRYLSSKSPSINLRTLEANSQHFGRETNSNRLMSFMK